MGYKLKSAAVSHTTTFQLKDAEDNLLWADGPLGEDGLPTKLPVNVTVYGPASPIWAEQDAKASERAMERFRKKGKTSVSPDVENAERARKLTALTVGFDNIDPSDFDNKTGRDLHIAIYSDREIGFIADQVEEKVKTWEGFTKG